MGAQCTSEIRNGVTKKHQVVSYDYGEWPVSFPRILGSPISETQKCNFSHAFEIPTGEVCANWNHSCIWENHDSSPREQPWNTWKCHIKPPFRDVVWHRERSAKYLIHGTEGLLTKKYTGWSPCSSRDKLPHWSHPVHAWKFVLVDVLHIFGYTQVCRTIYIYFLDVCMYIYIYIYSDFFNHHELVQDLVYRQGDHSVSAPVRKSDCYLPSEPCHMCHGVRKLKLSSSRKPSAT